MTVRVAARVLVVDDDEFILRLMSEVLSQDFAVSVAQSGEEALRLLEEEAFHAVVTDHMMPGMTGVELLRRVSDRQPDAARVLVTASSRMEDAQEAVNVARVGRFLTKPFRAPELLATVGEAVHEAALRQIKRQLVDELRARNTSLSRTLAELESGDRGLSDRVEGFAFRDPLTGLFNHRFLQEALRAELARPRRRRRPFALVLVDLDGFRALNDARGFAAGDEALQRVGQALPEAEAVARFGSNTFAALLPESGELEARTWAEQAVEAVRELAVPTGTSRAVLTARSGFAVHPEDGDSAAALIARAEERLAARRVEAGAAAGPAPG